MLTSIADKLNVDIETLLGKEAPASQQHTETISDADIHALIAAQQALRDEIRQLKDEIKIMISSHQEALRIIRHTE